MLILYWLAGSIALLAIGIIVILASPAPRHSRSSAERSLQFEIV